MNTTNPLGELARSPTVLVDALLAGNDGLLLWGETGSGKSTLATELAQELARRDRACLFLGADPGSPTFGVPGALCTGRWGEGGWVTTGLEPLCTLNSARFRLPLVAALGRLISRVDRDSPLLIDAPGVTRGVAGAELLLGIVEAVPLDAVLVLQREGSDTPLQAELESLGLPVFIVPSSPQAHSPTKRARARQRTALWDAYLGDVVELNVDTKAMSITGTPPPDQAYGAWTGRQVALRRRQGAMLGLGEVITKTEDSLKVRMRLWRPEQSEGTAPVIKARESVDGARSRRVGLSREEVGSEETPGEDSFPLVGNLVLLVRDACRDAARLLGTAPPPVTPTVRYQLPADMAPAPELGVPAGPRPVAQLGATTAILINGVLGDPLLHLRLRQYRRSLLFDLGEAVRLPARIAHQVSDVFISHAHIDHIGGFLWFLRSRIGEQGICRFYGPPGLAEHIRGMVSGILWDRVGDLGPRFEVAELHGEVLRGWRVQAGVSGMRQLNEVPVRHGLLRDEPAFSVRAATLEHGTPVLAFAFEPAAEINVEKTALERRGLLAGPWVGELKRCVSSGDRSAVISLPDGSRESVAALAEQLLRVMPGQKLVYATDLADTPGNRSKLAALASRAHTFFCEAGFAQEDVEQARGTGHLTARACGEIATSAGVERLIPFHFSRRYEEALGLLYREVRSACSCTVVPEGL